MVEKAYTCFFFGFSSCLKAALWPEKQRGIA
jgi:hypothetical protein